MVGTSEQASLLLDEPPRFLEVSDVERGLVPYEERIAGPFSIVEHLGNSCELSSHGLRLLPPIIGRVAHAEHIQDLGPLDCRLGRGEFQRPGQPEQHFVESAVDEPVEAEVRNHPQQEIGLRAAESPFEPGAEVRLFQCELLVGRRNAAFGSIPSCSPDTRRAS